MCYQINRLSQGRRAPTASQAAGLPARAASLDSSGWEDAHSKKNLASRIFHFKVSWFSQADKLCSLLQEVLLLLQSANMTSGILALSKQTGCFHQTFCNWVSQPPHDARCPPWNTLEMVRVPLKSTSRNENIMTRENAIWILLFS